MTFRLLLCMVLACVPLTVARAADQYLLLNYSTSIDSQTQAAEMMTYVHDKFGAAGKASSLKAGVAIIYTPKERLAEHALRLKADLDLAKQLQVPVLIQVDTENWLPESLLNWYDPQKPGYDPAKVADVEWYGWTPDTAVKLCWRNWGTMVRVGPHPNFPAGISNGASATGSARCLLRSMRCERLRTLRMCKR